MENSQPIKIAFFGTPEFASIILQKLINSEYKPSLVITMPDAPVGRKQILTPPPVKTLAQDNGIKVYQPEKLSRTAIDENYDLAIVAAYGAIIPKDVLKIPKYGNLNVHPSILPKWRGPSPIQYAILNGDEEMGITIMLLDEELDHGPILKQSKFLVSSDTTSEVLLKEFAEIGANMLLDTIPQWINGEIKPVEQDHEKATFSKILTKEDGRIDWSKSAEQIDNRLRALTPWPGIFTFFHGKRLKVIKGRIYVFDGIDGRIHFPKNQIGEVISDTDEILVQTGEGIFAIGELQPEGKNVMTARQFINGYPDLIGSVLGD